MVQCRDTAVEDLRKIALGTLVSGVGRRVNDELEREKENAIWKNEKKDLIEKLINREWGQSEGQWQLSSSTTPECDEEEQEEEKENKRKIDDDSFCIQRLERTNSFVKLTAELNYSCHFNRRLTIDIRNKSRNFTATEVTTNRQKGALCYAIVTRSTTETVVGYTYLWRDAEMKDLFNHLLIGGKDDQKISVTCS